MSSTENGLLQVLVLFPFFLVILVYVLNFMYALLQVLVSWCVCARVWMGEVWGVVSVSLCVCVYACACAHMLALCTLQGTCCLGALACAYMTMYAYVHT
jgi:hypothetical protein